MEETEVAAFGDMVGKWMGCERRGFEVMAGSDSACITMIGPALNRPIRAASPVHLGVSCKRDGLTACCRRSVFSTPALTHYEAFLRQLVEDAFETGLAAYADIAAHDKPAKLQEQALVDFFTSRTEDVLAEVRHHHGATAADELRKRLFEATPGLVPGLARLKPYTGTHNAGYTECQEFYGAITLDSESPLDRQVVTMLDVALRGRGSKWLGEEFEQLLPGFDYWVVEDTLGKYGTTVRNLTGELQPGGRAVPGIGKIPVNAQALVGNVREFLG